MMNILKNIAFGGYQIAVMLIRGFNSILRLFKLKPVLYWSTLLIASIIWGIEYYNNQQEFNTWLELTGRR